MAQQDKWSLQGMLFFFLTLSASVTPGHQWREKRAPGNVCIKCIGKPESPDCTKCRQRQLAIVPQPKMLKHVTEKPCVCCKYAKKYECCLMCQEELGYSPRNKGANDTAKTDSPTDNDTNGTLQTDSPTDNGTNDTPQIDNPTHTDTPQKVHPTDTNINDTPQEDSPTDSGTNDTPKKDCPADTGTNDTPKKEL